MGYVKLDAIYQSALEACQKSVFETFGLHFLPKSTSIASIRRSHEKIKKMLSEKGMEIPTPERLRLKMCLNGKLITKTSKFQWQNLKEKDATAKP